MSILTDELAEDHAAILKLLDQAGAEGVETRTGQETLRTAKEVLLSHFRKEDTVVYPALMKASEKDIDIRQMLNVFLLDLESITRSAMQFLDTYCDGGAPEGFKKDLDSFKKALRDRIYKEESVLYTRYDALY